MSNPLRKLSKRELEVVSQLIKGLPDKAIANILHIAVGTVKLHMKSIFKKLNVNNRVSAAVLSFNYLPNKDEVYLQKNKCDWPEYDNFEDLGDAVHKCNGCGRDFFGYRGRVDCYECAFIDCYAANKGRRIHLKSSQMG